MGLFNAGNYRKVRNKRRTQKSILGTKIPKTSPYIAKL